MARTDNYLIQAQQAKACFLTYDAEALAKKLNAKLDADFLYTTFFGQSYRVSRKTGDIQRLEDGAWRDGNSYEEVMTLLDLICDSREDRRVSGRWKAMQDFGLRRILYRHLKYPSPYNTYINKGLPPSPICMPSIDAIDAVLGFERHDYIFFCARPTFDGYHNFARTLREHNANARAYSAELNRRKIK